jgi:predicted phosphodiesterase
MRSDGNPRQPIPQPCDDSRAMRILTVSDVVAPDLTEHFDRQRFDGIDLILSCGDLPPEYLSFLTRVLNSPLFFVRGNHDIRYQSKPPQGCIDLHSRLIRFKGLNILGLEGSMWYNGGPSQYTDRQMRNLIRRLRPTLWWRGGVDIVLTHAPPRGIHDAEDRCHRGFEGFHLLIERYRPSHFIHGHIHRHFTDPAERESLVSETRVINSYGYCVIEIDDRASAE